MHHKKKLDRKKSVAKITPESTKAKAISTKRGSKAMVKTKPTATLTLKAKDRKARSPLKDITKSVTESNFQDNNQSQYDFENDIESLSSVSTQENMSVPTIDGHVYQQENTKVNIANKASTKADTNTGSGEIVSILLQELADMQQKRVARRKTLLMNKVCENTLEQIHTYLGRFQDYIQESIDAMEYEKNEVLADVKEKVERLVVDLEHDQKLYKEKIHKKTHGIEEITTNIVRVNQEFDLLSKTYQHEKTALQAEFSTMFEETLNELQKFKSKM